MRRAFVFTLAIVALAIALTATACNAPGVSKAPSQSGTAVNIKDMAYSPKQLQTAVGTEVRWANNDSTVHQVAADDGSFNSGALQPNRVFRFTFSKPGTYTYYDPIYPSMKGQIVVK